MAKRSRTREARQRRQKQRRQNKRLLVLALVVAAAVVGIAVVVVSNQPVEAHIADDLSARYQGIERSNSPEGYPRLGNPDAPVTMEEYASFACPGCQAFHSDSLDAVLERVRDEQLLFTYVPLNTGSIPNAPGASRAALCVGQQGMFWEMHDVLFDWQTRYGNTAFSQNRLLTGVAQLGLNSDAFTACFNSAGISRTLESAADEGISTTPTLRVNGVTVESSQAGAIPSADTILQAIDDATPAEWGQASAPTQTVLPTDTALTSSAPATDDVPPSATASQAIATTATVEQAASTVAPAATATQ
ncbi:MAG: thioredoxin domain-containing protein [Chloroflexi bacterium]|nr:thioredoxin domain-containing protein [Chloroflexota bacterium]